MHTNLPGASGTTLKINPLLAFTLQGQTAYLDSMAVAQTPLFGDICLKGQGTVFCAPPNAGKTLITMSLIIEAIEQGRVRGEDVFYVNADDTTQGLAEKQRIMEEYGVHMLAQGYRGFKATMLTPSLELMIADDTADGICIVLDTFKKFTQPMSKSETSKFTDVIRRFVLKGGTLLCLSHTNKKPDANGRNIFAGVSDIIDDLDCAYMIDVKPESDQRRTATFTNIKRRGNAPDAAAYTYSGDPKLSYVQRLASVVETDPAEDRAEAIHDGKAEDEEILHDLGLFIHYGNDIGKMELVRATALKLGVSKQRVLKLLEHHTGDDPTLHRWSYVVRARGRHAYALVPQPQVEPEG